MMLAIDRGVKRQRGRRQQRRNQPPRTSIVLELLRQLGLWRASPLPAQARRRAPVAAALPARLAMFRQFQAWIALAGCGPWEQLGPARGPAGALTSIGVMAPSGTRRP